MVWPELRWVEPLLTAVRTGSPLKLRQEKIVPLKNFACGHRVDVNSEGDPVVASPQENVITRISPVTGANAYGLSIGRTGQGSIRLPGTEI